MCVTYLQPSFPQQPAELKTAEADHLEQLPTRAGPVKHVMQSRLEAAGPHTTHAHMCTRFMLTEMTHMHACTLPSTPITLVPGQPPPSFTVMDQKHTDTHSTRRLSTHVSQTPLTLTP